MISEFLADNSWTITLVHLILAVLLFFIVNWIGRNSIFVGYQQLSVVFEENSAPAFNFLFKVLAPTVYLILCVALFQSVEFNVLTRRCYLIVVYYWAIRFVWNLLANRWILFDWGQMPIYWIVSIGLSLWIYKNIENVNSILPKREDFISEMWLLIIAFVYTVVNKMNIGKSRAIRRKDAYIKSQYEKFKTKYDSIIHPFFSNPFYEVLTYAIMIYEDFNRPFMIRIIEYANFFLTQKPHTLGIMQVKTEEYINSKESVALAVRKIALDNNEYLNARLNNPESGDNMEEEVIQTVVENSEAVINSVIRELPNIYRYELISHICDSYNGGDPKYSDQISEIFSKIEELFYTDGIPNDFSNISL